MQKERFEQLIIQSVSEAVSMVPSAAASLQPAGDETPTKQQRVAQPSAGLSALSGVGNKRGAEDDLVHSSAKRAHTPSPALSQILPQPDIEMSSVLVSESAVEVNALFEERVDKPDLEAFFR